MLLQGAFVSRRPCYAVRSGRPEAETAGLPAGLYARVLHVENLGSEHRDEPPDGTGESLLRPPPHRLREVERIQGGGEAARHDLLGRRPAVEHLDLYVLPGDLEFGEIDALRPREPAGGLRGLPVLPEGDLGRGAGHDALEFRLPVGEIPDDRRKPSGRREHRDLAEREARLGEAFGDRLLERRHGRGEISGRDLLDAKFEQEVLRHRPLPSPSPSPRRVHPSEPPPRTRSRHALRRVPRAAGTPAPHAGRRRAARPCVRAS